MQLFIGGGEEQYYMSFTRLIQFLIYLKKYIYFDKFNITFLFFL